MTGTPYQVMPALAPDEFEALKADIAARGVQVPVEYDEMGNILDGHHRVQACHDLQITHWPRLVRHGMTEAEKRRHARRLNLDRRHLNGEQKRSLIAAELKENPASSDRAIGAGLNVDHKTVGAVREAMETTGEIPQLEERQGRDKRTRRITQFVPATPEDERGLLKQAKAINARERDQRRVRINALHAVLSENSAPLPQDRKYPVIYADPATEFRSGFGDRSIKNHYPTESIEYWCELPVGDLALPACRLFVWTTVPQLAATITQLLPAWGFEYKSCCCWDKTSPEHEREAGTGYWFRNQHELLLLATRGEPALPAPADVPVSMYRERKRTHSAKPDFYREMIEAMTPGLPRIELFARTRREGWERWGNEAEAPGSAEAAE